MTDWLSLRRTAAVLLTLLLVPNIAIGQEVTAVDGVVNHTDQTGGFLTRSSAVLPTDLTAPNDYSTGTLHHRLEVTATPGTNETTYAICLVQGANEACSDYSTISFTATGTVTTSQDVNTFTNFAGLDWTQAIDSIKLVAGDVGGLAVDTTDNTMWVGSPDYALYYPLDANYVAVLVANGETFSGFPGDPAMQAANPTFTPGSGTFTDSVRVDIESTTPNAEIFYTTDGSDPDMASTMYTGTLTLTNPSNTVKAIAYASGFDPSDVSTSSYTITQATNGLRARYYNGRSFGDLAHTRTDARIEFSWADGEEPAPDTQANSFSVLWTGTVEPLYSEVYTFKTRNDDGCRVWVNNQLIIDDWEFHGPLERTGDVSLQAGQQYDVWIEYFNGGGSGEMSFTWVSSTQPEEIVPDSLMTPNATSTTPTVSLLMDEDDATAAETQSDPIVMQISRRGALDQAVRVELSFGGTAVNGEDYEQMPAFLDIPAGALSANLEISPIVDGTPEEEETIIVTITESGSYGLGQPITQEITLQDFDVDTFNIAGTVVYTGTVSGKIFVQAFTDQNQEYEKREIILVDPGPFAITDVEEGEYNVVAFIDTNDNETLDLDEIWNVIEDAEGNATKVTIPPNTTDLVLNLDQPPPGTPEDESSDDGGCAVTQGSNPTTLFLLIGLIGLIRARRRRS